MTIIAVKDLRKVKHEVPYVSIPQGATFMWKGGLYLKMHGRMCTVLAPEGGTIRCPTGGTPVFSDSTLMLPVNISITIED